MSLIILFLSILFFLTLKAANLGIRLSDSNIYYYTGWLLLQGKTLYHDIFFTNFPLFPIISATYAFIFKNVELFYFTAAIEAVGVAILIFFSVKKKYADDFISMICSLIYLFSFIILVTTDHQSGVFIASLFSALTYLLYLYKKPVLLGISLGICIMIKAYFLPIPLAFFLFFILKERKLFLPSLLSFIVTLALVLFPFIINSYQDFIKDIIQYSLVRSAGLSKWNIIKFFTMHDLLLIGILLFSFLNYKKNILFTFVSTFSLLFIFLYSDIYYLYLNLLIPFLCIVVSDCYYSLQQYKWKYLNIAISIFIAIIASINISMYFHRYTSLSKVDVQPLVNIIKKEKPAYLYGENDITPVLAYLTNIPFLNKSIDTNANIFRKGFLNAKTLSKEAIKNKTIIVSHGLDYPELGIQKTMTGEIFDITYLMKHCVLVGSARVTGEGPENRINLFKCY